LAGVFFYKSLEHIDLYIYNEIKYKNGTRKEKELSKNSEKGNLLKIVLIIIAVLIIGVLIYSTMQEFV